MLKLFHARSLAIPIGELINKNQLENNIQILPIELPHISYLEKLPQHHKDPFDRIMIAQAIIEPAFNKATFTPSPSGRRLG